MRRFALSDEPVAAPVAPEEKKPDNQSVELQELALLKHRVDGMTQTLDAIRQHLNTLPESGTTTITK